MKLITLLTLLISLITGQALARVEIKKLDFDQTSKRGKLSISYDGVLQGDPELLITGSTIQVLIPNSRVKRTIEKSVSFSSGMKDTTMKAYQAQKSISKIKMSFAFNIKNKKELVYLAFRDNKIELSFPKVQVVAKKRVQKAVRKKITNKQAKKKVKKEFLNESYLNNLLTIKKKDSKNKDRVKDLKSDGIKTSMAATKKLIDTNDKNSFSIMEYAGKFVAFLGVVLLMFYGVITLMKKGFIKKGKLGFLNNADQISVVSQTYIAPKKSLMLIKAHNQVFLVSNTDQGIHPISEIRDAAGLFKDGEKAISGHNFDSKLDIAQIDGALESKVKMKQDIQESNKSSAQSSYAAVKDKVKFSDQLKKKVKNLKPLQ